MIRINNLRFSIFFCLLVGIIFSITFFNNNVIAADTKDVTVNVKFNIDPQLFSTYNVDSITFKQKYVKLFQIYKTTTGSIQSPINLNGENEITKNKPLTDSIQPVTLAELNSSSKSMTLTATFPIDSGSLLYSHGDNDSSDWTQNIATYKYKACIVDNSTNKYSICSNIIEASSSSVDLTKYTINVGNDKISSLINLNSSAIDGNSIYVKLNITSDSEINATSPISVSLMNNISALIESRTRSNEEQLKTIDVTTENLGAGLKLATLSGVIGDVTPITSKNYKVCLTKDASICAIEDITKEIVFQKNDGVPVNVTFDLSKEQYDTLLGSVGTKDGASSCSSEIGGLGWVLCPVVNTLASIADGAYGQIEKLLVINPTTLFNQDNTTYKVWQNVRNIANALFVIAFLIITFSQMTSVGITNYGVKKLLPRLIIAAILVNVSYYLCQIAVDLSNILGSSLKTVLSENIMTQGSVSTIPTWSSIAASVLGGLIGAGLIGAGLAIAVWSSLPLLLIALLAAVAAVLVALLILVARQAVIILLIVAAPIAFVAYLLPNTSKIFADWKKMFIGLLMVYPVIAVVFGGSNLVAKILNNAFADSPPGDGQMLGSIVVAAANILPLVVVPLLLKKSLDSVPMLGKFANDLSNKANANMGKKFSENYNNTDFARTRALKKKLRGDMRDEQYLEKVSKGDYGRAQNLSTRIRDRLGLPQSSVQGKLDKTSQRALDEMIKNSIQSIQSNMAKEKTGNPDFDKDAYLIELSADKTNRAQSRAAMHTLATMGRDKVLSGMVGNENFDQAALEEAMQANFGTLSKTATDLVMGEKIAFSNVNGAKLAGFSADTVSRYMDYLNKSFDPTEISKKAQSQFSKPNNTKSLAQLEIEEKTAAEANVNSFLAAIEDIRKDNSLQTSFSSKAGIEINKAMKDTNNGALHLAINNSEKAITTDEIVNQDNRIR